MIHICLKHCAHFAIILEENSSWSSQHQWSILLLHFICSFLFTTKFSNTTLPKRTCLCPSSCVPHSYLRVTIEHVRASAFESRSEHKLERENILIFFLSVSWFPYRRTYSKFVSVHVFELLPVRSNLDFISLE